MTDRKFTPPTEFPAEYVDGAGSKVVLLGAGPQKVFPFIGYDADGDVASWAATGMYEIDGASRYDLQDIPKRITTWHNVYPKGGSSQRLTRREVDRIATDDRLCVYRIERDEDGGNPEIFVEEME